MDGQLFRAVVRRDAADPGTTITVGSRGHAVARLAEWMLRTPLSEQQTLDAKIEPYDGPPLPAMPVEPPTLWRLAICILLGFVALYGVYSLAMLLADSVSGWLSFATALGANGLIMLVASQMHSRSWRRPTWWTLGVCSILLVALDAHLLRQGNNNPTIEVVIVLSFLAPMAVAGFAGAVFDRPRSPLAEWGGD